MSDPAATAHRGDPCIHCKTPHDSVKPGPCPTLSGCRIHNAEQLRPVPCRAISPSHDNGERRRLPLGIYASVVLCQQCFNREIKLRTGLNRTLKNSCRYSIPTWEDLKEVTAEPQPEGSKNE